MLASTSEVPFFFTHLFSWALTLIGASFVKGALTALVRALKSTRWPTVEGRVVSCVAGSHSVNEDGAAISFPNIEYRYSVGGVEHTGSRISFADFNHTGQAAQAYVEQHPPGGRVVVYYEPAQPEYSLLEPGIRVQNFVRMAFALGAFGSGAMLVFAFKAWRF